VTLLSTIRPSQGPAPVEQQLLSQTPSPAAAASCGRQHVTNKFEIERWALSLIIPRVRIRVSVSIVLGLATRGYSWIWPNDVGNFDVN